jgi:serine/threonine protein kinase
MRAVSPFLTRFANPQKIGDFGLARFFDDSVTDEDWTMCGTANYISPELIEHEPSGTSSDIWSLGCILYALLCGNPPFMVSSPGRCISFKGRKLEEILSRVSSGVYSIPRHVSRPARDLIDSMMMLVRLPISGNAKFRIPFRELRSLTSSIMHSFPLLLGDHHCLP